MAKNNGHQNFTQSTISHNFTPPPPPYLGIFLDLINFFSASLILVQYSANSWTKVFFQSHFYVQSSKCNTENNIVPSRQILCWRERY